MSTLFGHLVARFSSNQAENIATEGLHYVLTRSAAARRLLTRLLGQSGVAFPDDLTFSTQAAEADGAIPDLIGRDSSGKLAVIVESKFWAGLTARQPNTYLARLPPSGLLLFVAPALRFESLWPELVTRCREGGHAPGGVARGSEWLCVPLAGDRRLALVSWRTVLGVLHHGLTEAGESAVAADVHQLRGLTDRMDAEAFLPFSSEELTGNVGRRIIQLCDLVDDAVGRLCADGLADAKGLRASGGRHAAYNRYFVVRDKGCRLYFDPHGWAVRGIPLTLAIGDRGARDPRWVPSRAVCDALQPLGLVDPTRLIVTPDQVAYIPIRTPTGVERDAVLNGMLAQLREVVELLHTVPPRTTGGVVTPTVSDGPNDTDGSEVCEDVRT